MGRASGERLLAERFLAYTRGDPLADRASSADEGECALPRSSEPKVCWDGGRIADDERGNFNCALCSPLDDDPALCNVICDALL